MDTNNSVGVQPNIPNAHFQLLQNPKIILSILGLLAIIVGIFLFFSLKSSDQEKKQNVENENKATVENIPPTSIPHSNGQDSLYTDNFFTFDYPDDWVTEKETTQDATIVIFQEVIPSEKRPVYMITYDDMPQTLEERVNFLSKSGFKRSVVQHFNIPFIRLQGSMPFRQIDGELAEVITQETSLYARLNGKYVTIKYLYTGDSLDESLEEMMESFIERSSFHSLDQ